MFQAAVLTSRERRLGRGPAGEALGEEPNSHSSHCLRPSLWPLVNMVRIPLFPHLFASVGAAPSSLKFSQAEHLSRDSRARVHFCHGLLVLGGKMLGTVVSSPPDSPSATSGVIQKQADHALKNPKSSLPMAFKGESQGPSSDSLPLQPHPTSLLPQGLCMSRPLSLQGHLCSCLCFTSSVTSSQAGLVSPQNFVYISSSGGITYAG